VTDEYHLTMSRFEDIQNVDAIVVAVAHKQFMSMNATDYKKMMNSNNPLLADVKHIFRKEEFIEQGVGYWSL
jgi:UDP-N-acetyl-D-galactosamine dehydrogenase